MRERRGARVGTVSGLALLTGGTAVAAVTHGTSSIFPTIMLGLLAAGLGHALATEIQRQARRDTAGWAAQDTINTALLTAWTAGALIMTLLPVTPPPVRAVGLLLSFGYALSSAYFVTERHRTRVRASASEKAGLGHHTASTDDSTSHEQSRSSEATRHAPTTSAPAHALESATATAHAPASPSVAGHVPASPSAPGHVPAAEGAPVHVPGAPSAPGHIPAAQSVPGHVPPNVPGHIRIPPSVPTHSSEAATAPAHAAAPPIAQDSAIDSVPAEPVN